MVKKLLEKNRQKRPSLEETLQHKWFIGDTDLAEVRSGAKVDMNGLDNKFELFTITSTKSGALTQDIKDLSKQKEAEAK